MEDEIPMNKYMLLKENDKQRVIYLLLMLY